MYLIFDTETTGLPKKKKAPLEPISNWPRLVQLAWMVCDCRGGIISKENRIIEPDNFEIPIKVAKIHGISTQIARKEGDPLVIVLHDFLRASRSAKFLVAHNTDFHKKVLLAEFMRNDIRQSLHHTRTICTVKESMDFYGIDLGLGYRYGYKYLKLPELYSFLFNRPYQGGHNASDHVIACSECFFAMLRRGLLSFETRFKIQNCMATMDRQNNRRLRQKGVTSKRELKTFPPQRNDIQIPKSEKSSFFSEFRKLLQRSANNFLNFLDG